LRKGAFLHYIEFLKTRRCNDYDFSKNAAAFYQKSVLTAEDGLVDVFPNHKQRISLIDLHICEVFRMHAKNL